ncbi:sugar phosphate isomerase/epimerase and 4-hydroxyphenylpyruvate domain-containing protein [Leucobacter weissii]|uniref:3-dehydroshikimate dehydratase n=1 Tax=Leucobacter weissii TaxID=1983706 RepID=A0A939S4M5_9MICO|nr:sugar phosphate isomerase/epimerase and 4-hydroxyphenylpyruvate domain-containing protein [Leucobacter weissii]MBO1900429.1 sugar phosphate isomerase/epimerase and 4-hydroxyphenylpyruvate domain-containing protein [Leucobacter weissii]
MRTSIATVCLSGGLVEKLHACAEAGFDGVEIMDADLVAAFESPEEIRALCARLGLSIDMYQPLRDVEGVDELAFADNLRRAEAKFDVMERLGTDLMLLCSNAGTATVDDESVAARQLGELADRAARRGIRIAYEALAWGRYVNDYRDAWRLVQRADRPNLGVCLDSFHVLSRGHDPSGIEKMDPAKLFFLQLADAPELQLDLLSWSRHHRLFPGEGEFDLVGFLGHTIRAGYTGPLSLEVFNDTFRQTDVNRTAQHALRSLNWLSDRTAAENGWTTDRLDASQDPTGVDFVEIAGEDLSAIEQQLDQLGFAFAGRHRSKAVRLWRAGDARIIVNEQTPRPGARLRGLGLLVGDAEAAARRGQGIGAPSVFRRTSAGEQHLSAVAAPDGIEVYWADAAISRSWQGEFDGGYPAVERASDRPEGDGLRGRIDHINIATPWQHYDEAVLFNTSVLGLDPEAVTELPGPRGLVRSQVMRTADGAVRLAMNLVPPTAPLPARHIAVRVDDALSVARHARARGLRLLPIPSNYYDDLEARFGLDPDFLSELADLGVLYDRDATGAFIHFYAPTIDGVFFEIVQRIDGYDGYGASNAPVRLAAQPLTAAPQG